jgi:pyruvate carboxylase
MFLLKVHRHSLNTLFVFVDIVQSTFLIAGGASLEDIGLKQENIVPRGVAMQCRITTEDPGKFERAAY